MVKAYARALGAMWCFFSRVSTPLGNADVGPELRRILKSDPPVDYSVVFGCSPPVRAPNPVCRDGLFLGAGCSKPGNSPNLSLPMEDYLEMYGYLLPKV